MQSPLPHTAPLLERLLPAWVFSIVFHASAIALLAVLVQRVPRGAGDGPAQSTGIVLKRASAEGNIAAGESGISQQVAATQVQPPELLPESPSKPPSTNVSKTSPRPPVPTAMPDVDPTTASGGQPSQANTGQRTAGGGRRGSPGGGGDAQVAVFGVQGKGSKFVYLFDRSASMEGPPLAAARRQLVESMQSLESMHQFHIIFFNTRTHSFDSAAGGRRIAFATERNKQLASNFVGGIVADGGTDRMVALREAITYAPDVIFFLTDADDPMPPSELAEIARWNGRAQAAICVIEFGRRQSGSPGNFLTQLAEQSGGQYGYVNTATLR